jgi:hypothetical protein
MIKPRFIRLRCFVLLVYSVLFSESFSNRQRNLIFQFASNGVCVQPQFFLDAETENKFTMRNVPGEGDCMFLAVALAAATSMGLGGNDTLLKAISRETREVVAQVLESDGNLYISENRLCPAKQLLESAARDEGIEPSEYLEILRGEGGGESLQGGGPELTVLANVLRRPISIYELAARGKEGFDSEHCEIVRKGTFGKDLFSDPCATIPNSAVLSEIQPGAYSWQLHILVLDTSPTGKHACVLLPQKPV